MFINGSHKITVNSNLVKKSDQTVYRHFNNDVSDKEYIDLDSVKLALLNGIHLEKKDMFNKQVCYKALGKCGYIIEENEIDFENLNKLCMEKKQNDKQNCF